MSVVLSPSVFTTEVYGVGGEGRGGEGRAGLLCNVTDVLPQGPEFQANLARLQAATCVRSAGNVVSGTLGALGCCSVC